MSLLDVIFPRFCFGCGFLGCYVCPSCVKKLVLVADDTCFYCGKRSAMGLTHPGCRRRNGVDAFVAVYKYNATIQKIIKSIKYRGAKEGMGDFLAGTGIMIMERALPVFKLCAGGIIQPVPLHASKQARRGFNQAEIIGGFISRATRIPQGKLLERIKNTTPQAEQKTKGLRRRNVAHSMRACVDDIGKKVLIVDDVVTSGATAGDAARALKVAGAPFVAVFALAKG